MTSIEKKSKELLIFRQKYLATRKVSEIADSLGALSVKWLDKKYPFRQKALKSLVNVSGFSAKMSDAMLDSIFSELTAQKLKKLLVLELGNARVLDEFYKNSSSAKTRAFGPRILTHVFSANLPNPAILSVVCGMLLKSVNVAKVSNRDPGILEFYFSSLAKHDLPLSKTNWLMDAKDRAALKKWIGISDAVTVYGNQTTLEKLWAMAGPKKIFTGYGHRVSFSLYSKEVMGRNQVKELAKKTARDIWMADQRGCLSPSVIYVEEGGEISGRKFATVLAEALQGLSSEKILGSYNQRILDKEALKSQWKLKKASGQNVFYVESERRGEWIVFYEDRSHDLLPTFGAQTIFVREFKKLSTVYDALSSYQEFLQAAAIEAPTLKRQRISEVLSHLGVNRITRAGSLQSPPVTWHHDGQPNFSRWLRWTDIESSGAFLW